MQNTEYICIQFVSICKQNAFVEITLFNTIDSSSRSCREHVILYVCDNQANLAGHVPEYIQSVVLNLTTINRLLEQLVNRYGVKPDGARYYTAAGLLVLCVD